MLIFYYLIKVPFYILSHIFNKMTVSNTVILIFECGNDGTRTHLPQDVIHTLVASKKAGDFTNGVPLSLGGLSV